MDEKKSQRETILQMLRQGSVTNLALNTVCFRYSARIHELRHQLRENGQDIVSSRVGPGVFQYRITSLATGPVAV